MKRILVTDATGRILASAPHPHDILDPETRKHASFGFLPREGQHIHEVELPAHIRTLEQLTELHRTHRVVVTDNQPTLKADR